MTTKDFKLNGLKVRICQMKVVPGRPDINAQYVIEEIRKAIADGIDLIIFPEMCIPGYMIGDMPEDECFIRDICSWNDEVRDATAGSNIVAIFGSIISVDDKTGEDGRLIKSNAAIVVQHGECVADNDDRMLGPTIKTLQPNYRMFDDDRHYVSARKILGMVNVEVQKALTREFRGIPVFPDWMVDRIQNRAMLDLEDLLSPIVLDTQVGKLILLLFICEDGWDADYAQKVFSILRGKARKIQQEFAQQGIPSFMMAVDISCSPWGWQKNRKRNSVMKAHLVDGDMSLIYVNNTGIQNNGKNIIIFDGSSTVYGPGGEIVFEVPSYVSGSHDIVMTERMEPIEIEGKSDITELYAALECAASEMIEMLPKHMRKMVIPISGGIDSSLAAAFYAPIIKPENLILLGLPTVFNDDELNGYAAQLANNIGAEHRIISIEEMVRNKARLCGVRPGTLQYQNIQPKERMIIASTIAQQIGGVFPCQSNKVELLFGYSTQYGDLTGFLALFGDLIKREVYQTADFLNRVKFGREVIPAGCFTVAPTAALEPGQKDPFDYGNLDHRGFHDEFVRASTEFRKNPEWSLEKYLEGSLEDELKLNKGNLETIFPTAQLFVENIEWGWEQFHGSYFKRIQGMPIPIVSKRAFGYDLRESMVSAHYTKRYKELKRELLSM